LIGKALIFGSTFWARAMTACISSTGESWRALKRLSASVALR
jgi:predicted phage tail protein